MFTTSITISLSVDNVARADIHLTPSRAYYHFATSDTCEDGAVPCSNLNETISNILDILSSNDQNPMPSDVKCEVIINSNNLETRYDNSNISLHCYNSLISILFKISDEFTFIRGFK